MQSGDDTTRPLTRRTLLKLFGAGVSGLTVGSLLAACAPAPVAAPTSGALTAPATSAQPRPAGAAGELKIATTTEGVTLHPFKVTDTPSEAYISQMFSLPLLEYERDSLALKPMAAASVAESADHRVLTFALRDNLQWSDGHSLTAADYAWTWAQATRKDNGWPKLGTYEPYIEAVRDTDPRTLEVTLKDVLAISREKVTLALQYVLPRHVWETRDWNDPNTNSEIFKPSVVAGPYKLSEWRKDEYASFVANDKYVQGRPKIDKLTYRIFGNANVATQALLNGEVDLYGPEPENWSDVKESARVNALQWDAVDAAVTYIGLDTRLAALKDNVVRQALNYGLDKDAIVGKLTYDLGKRATTMYPPSSWAYDPSVNTYPYDPGKANQLLEAAGWKPGPGGVREKDGVPLKLLFLYGPNTTPVREQLASVAQQQWKALGADVEVRGMEWGAYLKQTREGPYDWSAFVNAYIASVDPDIIWWKRTAGPAYNRVDYQNSKVQELYEQGLKELDQGKRQAIYREIDRILTDESPWIWLYYEQAHAGLSKRVQGVRPGKLRDLNQRIWEWSLSA
jgi:peptide/nickel transport system substrate-binding protein